MSYERGAIVRANFIGRVLITQDALDGLNALLHWLQGFESGGHGNVPGHHELVMHYRQLVRAVYAPEEEADE